jgi:hypothetical protein
MEELDGFRDSVFDEHALRAARYPFDRAKFEMVGQQYRRLLVSQRRQADPPPGGDSDVNLAPEHVRPTFIPALLDRLAPAEAHS